MHVGEREAFDDFDDVLVVEALKELRFSENHIYIFCISHPSLILKKKDITLRCVEDLDSDSFVCNLVLAEHNLAETPLAKDFQDLVLLETAERVEFFAI